MGFLRRLLLFRKKKSEKAEEVPKKEPKSFYLYIDRAPEIVTYFRREKQIPARELELVLIDCEEQPAWKIYRIVECLLPELNLLYLVTGREDVYEELTEKAFEENGLLIVLLPRMPEGDFPGNLVIDLNDWEKHLDIISEVSYNTMIV